ncbi:MAG TPA: Uma2 family endonuclease [Oscillatoriaceae cyanobacterium M33_DOE_052]|uniref:Uma2 family endonuclease n=1 Tax=Planktothricoides sp. SpSt-374 TaxID=2282167 RepID=A0A7C3ZHT1_9CYAN|nr:Uma2 family endonuclease [Oscillatoriaceae cyanobacterium M33_DOE_052]
MLVPTEKRLYTREEYLALEETAAYKNEYHDGEIVPMTGGTTNHNKICLNFCRKFPLNINQQDYDIYAGDVRLWIPQHNRYIYPDVMVIRGNPVYEGKGKTTVTNPLLIVEVLSSSTRNYDKGDKFDFYRSLPEFKEYILIDQTKYYVAQYVKTATNQWVLTEYNGENSVLALAAVEFQITFAELYARVYFDLEEE